MKPVTVAVRAVRTSGAIGSRVRVSCTHTQAIRSSRVERKLAASASRAYSSAPYGSMFTSSAQAWRKYVEAAAAACVVAFAASCATSHSAPSHDLQRIDDMRDAPETYSRKVAFDAATSLLERDPEDPAVQWRAARAAYDLAQEPGTPKAEAKALIDKALKLINSAKSKERNVGDIFRWSGIILSAAGDFGSTTDQIKNSFVIRDEFEQATYINPNDASAHHLLGRWHYTIATMSWVTRKLASTLFAEPPTATLDEAKEELLKAESISPGFWKANQVMLAKVEQAQGNKPEAVKWLLSALDIHVRTADDAKDHAEALKLLGSLDNNAKKAWEARAVERAAEDRARAEARAKGGK